MELLIVLVTGITTGGLTCLAVQGGLLASVVAAQANASPSGVPAASGSAATRPAGRNKAKPRAEAQPQNARADGPVLAFLAAKLIAYTALGFVLGATGSLVGVTPNVRGWLQLIAGVYMVATALSLLQVHPVFRFVVLQPPRFLTRRVRLASKSSNMFAPAALGGLTVFIPCGTTLAVEFFALSTGDPVYAAALMFAFVLGTSPVFYLVGRATTRMEGEPQARLMGFTAAAVLMLGLLSLNTAMNLLNYPLTYSEVEAKLAALPERITGRTLDDPAQASSVAAVSGTGKDPVAPVTVTLGATTQTLRLDVKSTAYSPNRLAAKADQPIRLELATNSTNGCTRAFTIPSLGIQKVLPATGVTVIDLPAQKAGTIKFTCSMGMYSGTIIVS